MNISTALTPIYVGQPHCIGSALYKNSLTCCKNKPETSTRPIIMTLIKKPVVKQLAYTSDGAVILT